MHDTLISVFEEETVPRVTWLLVLEKPESPRNGNLSWLSPFIAVQRISPSKKKLALVGETFRKFLS